MTAITARSGKEEDAPSATVEFDFGANLQEAETKFGGEVLYKRFCAAVTIDIQALIRRKLDAEKPATPEEIQAAVDDWKPGVQRARTTKKEKAINLLADMSEEDRAEILASLN